MKKINIKLIAFLILIVISLQQINATELIDLATEAQGSATLSIEYSQTKNLIFSYGWKKLIVYDATTKEVKFSEDISQYGQYAANFYANSQSVEPTFMFEDQANSKLYYTTLDAKLKRLDISDINNITSEVVYTPLFNPTIINLNIMKWDAVHRKLYWVFHDENQNCNFFILGIDNQNNVTKLHNPTNLSSGVFDVEFSTNGSYYYLSMLSKIERYAASDFSFSGTYNYTNESTPRKFFVKAIGSNFEKLFALPYNNQVYNGKISVINSNSGIAGTDISLPTLNAYSGEYFASSGHLIVGVSHNTPNWPTNDIIIYSASNGNLIANLNTDGYNNSINNCYSMLYYNNNMYLSKTDEIVKLSYLNGSYSFTQLYSGESNYFGKSAANTNNGNLFFTNQVRSGIEKFDSNNVHDFIQTGLVAYESVYYPDINKVVFFSKLDQQNSSLVMMNASDYGNRVTFQFDDPIGDCIYNKFNNDLLLVLHSGSNTYLKVYNPTTGNFDNTLNLGATYCGDMYISSDGKLFISSNMRTNLTPAMKVVKASNYPLQYGSFSINLPPLTDNKRYQADFTFNENYLDTYFTIHPNMNVFDPAMRTTLSGALGEFTSENSYIELSLTYKTPEKIIWASPDYKAPANGKCYFIDGYDHLIVWECDTDTQEASLSNLSEIIKDIETDAEKRNLYVLSNVYADGTNKIYSVDGNNTFNTKLTGLGNTNITGIDYNPNTYELLAYTKSDANSNCGLYSFDPNISPITVNYEAFDNKDLNMFLDYAYYEPGISFNTADDKMFIPNGFHTNATVIGYYPRERLELIPGYNWISIPRHPGNLGLTEDEYWPTPDVFDESNFDEDITNLYIQNYYINPSNLNPAYMYADYVYNNQVPWSYYPLNYTNQIYSTKGYKLKYTPDGTTNTLYMEGLVEDPTTEIQLYENNMNWVGYFLPFEQDAFDAIDVDVLADLTEIYTDNFYCYRTNGISPDGTQGPTHGVVGSTIWVCDKTDRTLHYGDGLDLTSLATRTFQWNTSGLFPDKVELRPEVEYYTYVKTADYTPIIIELDYETNPIELAAFIDTVCVGAVALLPEDTAVILKAYLDGSSADDIVFQEYYGTKSTLNNIVSDYSVYNKQTQKYERRPLKANTTNKQVFISFKNSDNTTETVITEQNIWPNPASTNININFRLEEESQVDIGLFDISGKLVSKIASSKMAEGNHNINFPFANNLSKGIYIIRTKIGNSISNNKLIIN